MMQESQLKRGEAEKDRVYLELICVRHAVILSQDEIRIGLLHENYEDAPSVWGCHATRHQLHAELRHFKGVCLSLLPAEPDQTGQCLHLLFRRLPLLHRGQVNVGLFLLHLMCGTEEGSANGRGGKEGGKAQAQGTT